MEVAAEAVEEAVAVTEQMNQTDMRQAGQKGSSPFRLPLTWKVWAILRVGLPTSNNLLKKIPQLGSGGASL